MNHRLCSRARSDQRVLSNVTVCRLSSGIQSRCGSRRCETTFVFKGNLDLRMIVVPFPVVFVIGSVHDRIRIVSGGATREIQKLLR